MKSFILCADDYGHSDGVSQGIIELIKQGRLSATSCMTTAPLWAKHARLLKAHDGEVQVGLHFNLTEGKPLTKPKSMIQRGEFLSLKDVLIKAHLRSINKDEVINELNAQLDGFKEHFGRLPDYIDGHQHVHHLPVIRKALVEVVNDRFSSDDVYIRLARNFYSIKSWVISLTGGLYFPGLLRKNNIRYNPSFSGIYDFAKAQNYRQYFLQFLQQIGEGGIVMCHPGLEQDIELDIIADSRYCEFQYLMSKQFIVDCEASNRVVLHK